MFEIRQDPVDLGLHIDPFLAHHEVSEITKRSHASALRQFLNFIGDNKLPQRDEILRFKNYLRQTYRVAETINKILGSVRLFFRYLDHKNIYFNIASGIKDLRTSGKEFKRDCLTIEQARNILESLSTKTSDSDPHGFYGKRELALFNLTLRCGLRLIEVSRIKIKNLRKYGPHEGILNVWGKGRDSADESVVLTKKTYASIKQYIKSSKAFYGYKPKDEDYLFGGRERNYRTLRPLSSRTLSRIIKRRFTLLGIKSERITPHSLRHTAITLALLGGASLQETSVFARHADINTTLIYAHNLNRLKSSAENKIDKLLNE